MTKKTVTVVSTLAATTLLASCAQTIVPGMGIEPTNNWGARDDITIEVTAQHHNTHAPATITVYQDQMNFDGNQADFNGEAYYKLTYNNLADLTDSQIRVTVTANDPTTDVTCAIKGTGYALQEGDHVNHANQAHGTGSATCTLNID
ncbi:hypothetical protein [Rothia sp. 88186D007BW]